MTRLSNDDINQLKSYTEVVTTGDTALIAVSFDYVYGKDGIVVTIDAKDPTTMGYTLTMPNATTVAFNPPVPTGHTIRLQRETDIDKIGYVFTSGALFIASNMDANFEQIRHAQQEVKDSFDFLENNTLGVVEAAKAATDRANESSKKVEDALDGVGSTTMHNWLSGRDVPNGHPASSISYGGTNVSSFLDSIVYAGKSFITEDYTTLAQLQANNSQVAFVKKSGISGQFVYSSSSTATSNGGTIIASINGGNWLRIYSGAVDISWFDLKLNGTDETQKLQTAANLGLGIRFSSAMTITITDTIKVKTAQHWEADAEIVIQYKAPMGTKIKPMLDATAKFTTSENFVFDHNSDSGQGGYLPNDVYGGNPIAGSAILLQADNCSMTKPVVRNAFDNGIAIVKLDTITNLAVPSSPVGVSITGARTYYCGFGTKAGAGIDNASGISNIVDAQDIGSYTGFINDIGAGARGVWSDLVSLWARRDGNSEQSGYGLYSGSPDSSFTNVTVIGAGYQSYWLDAAATNSRYVNLLSDAPQADALKLKGGRVQIIGFTAKNTGQAALNTYDDVVIDSSACDITDLIISNFVTDGESSRYGINCIGTNSVRGAVLGASISALTAKLNLNNKGLSVLYADSNTGFLSFNKSDAGVPFDFYGRMRVGAEKANASSTVDAFGDSNGNGTFIIEDFATPSKRMAMGYDPVNDFFAMQSMHVNTMKKPLILNPAGGDVGLTTGTWNTGCVRIGNYRLWIDVSGRLRIKNGTPTSDTDGSIVGTQS